MNTHRAMDSWFSSRGLRLLLFFAVPLFLAVSGNQLLFREVEDSFRTDAENRLELAFNRIEADRSPTGYYSRFFQRIDETVFSSPNPLEAWKKLVPKLRKHFRGRIDLQFLDGSGTPIPELCDRPVTRTLARRFFESYGSFLREKKELSDTARAFLKTFVSPMIPVDRDSHGYLHNASIVADKEFAYFSRPRPTGMIILFLRPSAPLREMALSEQIARFNRSTKDARLFLARRGEASERILNRLGLKGGIPSSFPQMLQRSATGKAWFGDRLLGYRSIFPSLRVFGVVSLRSRETGVVQVFSESLPLTFALCCCLILFIGRLMPVAEWVTPVRVKLILAFLYTVAVPLVIMGMTARSFLGEHRLVLENETWNEREKAIRTLDERFGRAEGEISEALRKRYYEADLPGGDHFRDFIERFHLHQKTYGFDFCRVYDASGKAVFAFDDSVVPTILGGSVKMFPKLAVAILARNNASGTAPAQIDPVLTSFGATLKPFMQSSLTVGRFEVYWHSIPLGNPESGITHMAYLLWHRKKMEWNYLRQRVLSQSRHDVLGDVYIWSHDSPGFSFPEQFRYLDQCRPLKPHVTSDINSFRGHLDKDGQRLLVTGLRGKHLKSFSLLCVTPDLEITRELATLAGIFHVITAAVVALSTLIGLLLTRLFLGPLGNLERGMASMARNDFATPIPIANDDELGRLARLFNDTMNDLKDLEVARSVQESFFPQEPLALGTWQVYGSCISATSVGGDYFDYIALDEHRALLIIGDVSGHGVGAALVVGMAKAVIGHPATSGKPLEILTSLNAMLLAILKRKKMMSVCLALFEHETGTLTLANAGHCYPVLLADGVSSFLEMKGYPLGSTRNWKATARSCPGLDREIVLFYTDGLIEALDTAGQPIGYDRFLLALPGLVRETAMATETAIRDWHRAQTRAGPPDDDMTLMVLQNRGKGSPS